MSPTVQIPTESSAAITGLSSPSSPLERCYQGLTAPAHRVRLCYRDEAYRQRSEARAKCLIAAAASPTGSSTSALLAKKALKYRKVYDRMTGVDVDDPNFDVFDFLGVDWCKSPSTETPGRV
jgi:hypothetical protein